MGASSLILTLLLLSPSWVNPLRSSDVTEEEMMVRMVNLVTEVRQQLEHLEQENIDLSIGMERMEKEMEEQVGVADTAFFQKNEYFH